MGRKGWSDGAGSTGREKSSTEICSLHAALEDKSGFEQGKVGLAVHTVMAGLESFPLGTVETQ